MIKRILLTFGVFLMSASSFAQTSIYIRGSGRLFPIGMPQLCVEGGDSTARTEIPKIIARDLDLSGRFEVLNPNSYIETKGNCSNPDNFAYSDWSVIGAEGLVRGIVIPDGPDVKVRMYLHIVPKQQMVLGKEYSGDPSQISKIAHRFANEVMKYFTGEYGVFGTEIAFTSRVGRFKELFLMDMDGSNVRQLTNDKSLNVSSGWHPNGQDLVFTSYHNRVPDLFMINTASKRQRQITRGSALDIGASVFKDGRSVIFSSTDGGDSNIVVADSNDGRIRAKLTQPNGAIDVSPSLSPDESMLAFVSNRSGGPQIYTMNADGSGARRVSFVNSNYCTSPDWSPKGDKLAFVCRADAGFQIFVSKADGSEPLQLTSSGDNEDPDWSPDGRQLVFATTFWRRGVFSLALMKEDGGSMRQLTNSRGGDYEPSWGPQL